MSVSKRLDEICDKIHGFEYIHITPNTEYPYKIDLVIKPVDSDDVKEYTMDVNRLLGDIEGIIIEEMTRVMISNSSI